MAQYGQSIAPKWSEIFFLTWHFSVNPAKFLSKDFNHFSLLEPKKWYNKWPAHGPKMGQMLPL